MPYAGRQVKGTVVNLSSDISVLRARLLDWYDLSGRTLPWRIRPEDRTAGVTPDPYAIWLSEIMLQQTTVPHGTPYWEKFLKRWPTVIDLANAERDEVLAAWAGLGYYARARNLHKCAGIIRDDFGGNFPVTEKELLKLPGIGPYTAATMAAICFGEATNIVDSNVERVIARLYAEDAPLPKSKKALSDLAAPIADPNRPGDYGQALMDLGSQVCTPKKPDCENCPWQFACKAFAQANPERYPVKIKKTRPIRSGAAFALVSGRDILLRKRSDQGLLGGMLELPGSDWTEAAIENPLTFAPLEKNWERVGQIKHVFTHFELRLDIYRAETSEKQDGIWMDPSKMADYPVPTLTKKAILRALKT